MKLIIAGIGPGNSELITIEAVNRAKNSDVIIVPRAHKNSIGLAEKIISRHVHNKNFIHIIFPMIYDANERDKIILSQLEAVKPKWENANNIFFPVIGDSMLYSTGIYLLEAFRKILPGIDAEFIPGISAHSLAASCAKRFLAVSDDVLCIIPGTADREKIRKALECSDAAAIYKPTALKDIHELAEGFNNIIRVDFAGIPEREKIFTGNDALKDIHEYISIILLWR